MIDGLRTLILTCTLLLLFLTGCSSKVVQDSGPSYPMDVSGIPDAVPRSEPLSRMGNASSYVVFGKRYYVLKSADNFKERGVASWYGNKFHGNNTANGEVYDMYAMTAAHKRLPLPSYVRVTNLNNNRTVVVRVNDRGPFHGGRIIDLSYAAASKLGMTKSGTAPVEVITVTGSQPVLVSSHHLQGRIAVQVGAYSLRSNAEKVGRNIHRLLAVSTSISEVISQGRRLYRVRLGPFKKLTTAQRWISKLENLSFTHTSLVYLD